VAGYTCPGRREECHRVREFGRSYIMGRKGKPYLSIDNGYPNILITSFDV
jgi:hypothetical protein